MSKRLSIVVPYRDREEHLKQFIPHMEGSEFLSEIDYEILIVEQDDNPFNRGKLLNIGAIESPDADYYCFHDVDMLPIISDYSFVENPTHLAAEAEQFDFRLPYEKYFGGVTLFDKPSFIKSNGYSNNYWGWGAEDDDVMLRCVINGIPTSRKNGRYRSLSHDRNIARDLYTENLRRYHDFIGSGDQRLALEKSNSDGLTTLEYKIVEKRSITEKTRLIKVQI